MLRTAVETSANLGSILVTALRKVCRGKDRIGTRRVREQEYKSAVV